MQLLQMSSVEPGVERLKDVLNRELSQGKHVLWLLPGGSNIPLCVQVMAGLAEDATNNLTLALTDERYGDEGSADSNWQQLGDAGFNLKQAQQIKVLEGPGQGLMETANAYAGRIGPLLTDTDVVIGQFGMGPDGHIAGILPGSPAVNASGLVAGYDAGQFQRITLTFEAIIQCDTAFLFAFGQAKRPMLESLGQDIAVSEQPAQIIKQIPESFVCNDQIGEEI